MMAASQDINGPPGKVWSFALCISIVLMLVLQPDFGQAALVLFGWGVMYFVAGASMLLLVGMAALVVFGGTIAYSNSEHFARRIDGFSEARMSIRARSWAMPPMPSKRADCLVSAWARGR